LARLLQTTLTVPVAVGPQRFAHQAPFLQANAGPKHQASSHPLWSLRH
jgi:hypothetical protein